MSSQTDGVDRELYYDVVKQRNDALADNDLLRAELAAERVLCESYLIDKNQITQAWADELDRVQTLKGQVTKLREALEPFVSGCKAPDLDDFDRARAVLKETGNE
jgi:hypothetical protein